jgi:hypothetical protein
MSDGLVMIGFVGLLVIGLAVTCFLLVVRGHTGVAWAFPIGILVVSVAFGVFAEANATQGQAGLAVFLLFVLFLLPLLAGAALGCLAGHLARWLRMRGGGPEAP